MEPLESSDSGGSIFRTPGRQLGWAGLSQTSCSGRRSEFLNVRGLHFAVDDVHGGTYRSFAPFVSRPRDPVTSPPRAITAATREIDHTSSPVTSRR
jgi:hypothetical protein